MADLTDAGHDDPVTCPRCGVPRDRAVYALCPEDGEDLWDTAELAAPEPPSEPAAPVPAPATTMDRRQASRERGLRLRACGSELELAPGDLLGLGRDESYPTAAVFAEHANVSRFHAVLRYDGDRLYVKDTASANGTYVNDQELTTDTEYEIRPGQRLRLASDVPIDVEWHG